MRSAPRAHCGVYWPRATTARGQPLDALPLPGFGAGSPCAQARAVTNGCCWCPLPARATDHTLARVPAAPAPFPTCARCARNRGSDARSQRSTCAKASVGRDGGPPLQLGRALRRSRRAQRRVVQRRRLQRSRAATRGRWLGVHASHCGLVA